MRIIENDENVCRYRCESQFDFKFKKHYSTYYYRVSEITKTKELLLHIINISTNRELFVVFEYDEIYGKQPKELQKFVEQEIKKLRKTHNYMFYNFVKCICNTCRNLFYVRTFTYNSYRTKFCSVNCYTKFRGNPIMKRIKLMEFFNILKPLLNVEQFEEFKKITFKILSTEMDAGECIYDRELGCWFLLLHHNENVDEYAKKVVNNLNTCTNTGMTMEQFVYLFLDIL